MSARRASTRVLSMLLVLCMVIGLMPMAAFAAETDTLAASLEEAKAYIDGITINSSSNDPEKVVKNFKTHFTWDNEKRENEKSYLFDWSYYNGVVFEGIEYLYEVTGDTKYKDYVVEYMSSLIASNGTWATCSNNSSKQCAGYDATHGADCYKTASLLLDAYEMTGDNRYLTVAETLYADLDKAAKSYSLKNAGNNFRHTWASDPSPDLWLDGLYMILPFRAEYAKHIGDTEELDLIVSRMQWVSDNMYNSSKGLFYHAADSASSNSGTFWLRSIGWYAAAIVDIMDSMSGDNFTAMQKQLVKLVDGMKACQNASNGMWLNNMAASQSSSNPYETSGTALVCYAVMKAVNNGWLDDSYADMAILAFNGICNEKLSGSNLTDICFKGAPGSSNSTFYDNEGKGVGPFIMFYAEVLEYYNKEVVSISVTAPTKTEYEVGEELDLDGMTVSATTRGGRTYAVTNYTVSEVDMTTAGTKTVTVTYGDLTASFEITVVEPETEAPTEAPTEPEETEPEVTEPKKEEVDVEVGEETIKVTVENVANVVIEAVSEEDKALVEENNFDNVLVFDMKADLAEGETATISIPVPAGWNENRVVGISVEDGVLKQIPGTVENGIFSFKVDHFSAKGIALAAATNTGTGYLVGSATYTLDTDGVDAGEKYLIVSNYTAGDRYALTNNNGTVTRTEVEITGNNNANRTITVENDTNIAWVFSGSTSGTVSNNGVYLYPNNNSLTLTEDDTSLTLSRQSNGQYRIYRSYQSGRQTYTYYIRYSNNAWTAGTSNSNSPYLFRQTSFTSGAEVTFTVTPASVTLKPNATQTLNGTVTVDGESVNLNNCTINWASKATNIASINNSRVVTARAVGTTEITATLSAVNGKALQTPIVLTIPVTVQSKEVESAELTGNDPINVTLNEKPDYSKIKYTVTYDDGTTEDFTYANGGLTFDTCDTSASGTKIVPIYYNGDEIGEVVVNVTVDFSKLPEADMEKAPQYPNDGAVRIDKTATHNAEEFNRTGVTHVELDVAGISVESAVDVILIMDISNSMSWDDSEYDYNDTDIDPDSNQRLNIARDSAKEFVSELMKDNGDDDPNTVDNTITMLAFAGIDGDFNDHSTARDNDDVYQVGDLAMDTIAEANAALNTLVKATTGGTNYDYAFQQAYELAEQLHEERGNRVYIVFMTDGVPTHYNGVYYKSRSNTDLTALMNYVDPTTGEESRYTSTGNDRNGNDIDSTATTAITVYYNDGRTANKNVTYNKGWSDYVINNKNGWAEKVKALDYVAHVYAIGFGMKNGSVTQGATDSMPTLNNVNGGQYYIPSSTTHAVLQHIASDANSHFEADDKEELTKLYQTLATQIKYAGTEAKVTDTVGNNFSVQMAPYVVDKDGNQIKLETPPTITIKTYDLYARGSTDAEGNDITGERTGDSQDVEIVTFNEDGTEAYSSVIGEGKNILTTDANGNITINAKYFTYTKTAATSEETFVWNIGNITDKEIALCFDAYLEGSMSGERPENVYYTNEEGIIQYVDINGNYAKKTFPRPGVAWGGATTTIRFYLVNEKGEPVNRDGVVVPWANRVYVGEPVIVTLNLNGEMEIEAQKIEAAAHVPSGFFLYDNNAYYIVETTSSTEAVEGGITVSDPSDDAKKTTGTAPNAVTQTGAQTTRVIAFEDPYYTWSIVGFGVRWDLTAEKTDYVLVGDQVVIDYGKAIQVDVLANDPIREGYTRELVGFVKYNAGTDLSFIQQNAGSATFSGAEYGTFTIDHGKVQFQPTEILNGVQKVFYAVRYTETANTQNSYIVWGQLDVIPATIMYYETDFATRVFNVATTGAEWATEGTTVDEAQAYVAIGETKDHNNRYGYDESYVNDIQLSNGSSLFVEGQGVNKTTAQFSFTGTGFDLISRTGTKQGVIRVDIYSDYARNNRVKSITVLNKSESNLELYQIPVVSAVMDAHGTYYVTIHVGEAYSNKDYPALDRGGEFYFDAIRVFNPIDTTTVRKGTDSEIAYNAYLADGEQNPEIIEVRNTLIAAGDFNVNDENEGVVFVDRNQGNVDVETYKAIGPNNEVYLAKGQAIGFNVKTGAAAPESMHIGVKSVNGTAAVLVATVYEDNNPDPVTTIKNTDIKTATVLFYELLVEGRAKANTTYTVVITNDGNGVLSITDLKIAGAQTSSTVEVTADSNLVERIKQVLLNDAPVVEEEEVEVPGFGVITAEFAANSAKRGETVTMVITTTEDVASVGVKNSKGADETVKVESVKVVDGMKVWTVTFKVNAAGDLTYTAVGYTADGAQGTTANSAIKVTIR